MVNGLDYSWDLIDERYCSCYVIQNLYIFYLLPRHGNVLYQLENSVGGVFQGTEEDTFVGFEFSA